MPRDHLVPQMYLRQFSDEKSRVTLVDRDDPGKSVRTGVKNACAEVGFYDWEPELDPEVTLDVEPALLRKDFIEVAYSVFEDRAVGPIRRILETGKPPSSPDDRYNLTHFVALQATRTRRFGSDLAELATLRMRQNVRANVDRSKTTNWLRDRGMAHDPASVQAFIDRATGEHGPRLVFDRAMTIQQSLRVAFETLSYEIWQRAWLVRRFDTPSLLTSDEPVCGWDPNDEPVTVATAPIVWLPLGRQHLLELRRGPITDDGVRGTDKQAEKVNSVVATNADRWIIHHPYDGHLVSRLTLGLRTQWGEEVLETIDEGDQVRVRGRIRRLPVIDPE